MDVTTRLELISRPPVEEILTPSDLRNLLETNERPRHYIGLEISGKLHIGNLLLNGFKINDCAAAGADCTVFLADWHTYINNKLGGDWNRIRRAARYFEEAFRFFCPRARLVQGSDLYRQNDRYWEDLVRFNKELTLARVTRCLPIMGRTEQDRLDFAQYLYPSMQAVDIRALDLDLVQAGLDQRKVHVLVREAFPALRWKVPVAVHTPLIPGLQGAERMEPGDEGKAGSQASSKMSKSKPQTAIFVHDTPEDIRAKLRRAWCPKLQTANNPVLAYVRDIVFHEKKALRVDRSSQFGGPVEFDSYQALARSYADGRLHPADLKDATATALAEILAPIRQHFEQRRELLSVFEDHSAARS